MAATEQSVDVLDSRDAAALTEKMMVLDDAPAVDGAPGMYLVVSGSGQSYRVDAREGRCECPDAFYRHRECKHLKRVAFATGEREIPDWADHDRVDPHLGTALDDDTTEEVRP